MANTTVTEAACDLCGAEIRNGSMYCYNCGTAVSETAPSETENVLSEIPPPPALLENEEQLNAEVPPTTDVNKRPPLRSAASLRRQRRAYNRQPVEVSWEPRTQTSLVFIIGSLVLVVGALALLLIALYLR